eukprot:m.73748 g.73748  ORF g.73748 m.73748 type:complete len:515 (+) comp8427_c0_seq3:122-1666(+)
MERGGRGGERGMMIDGRDSSSGERRKYHHSHTSGGGSRIGMRVFELLSELEGEIILLQAENASLRKRLAVAGLEVVDDPYIFPAEIQPLDAGIEGNNKGRSGKTVSKKIQEAYQASTNRLVSTFARTVEHSPFVCSPIQTYRGHEDGVWDVCAFNQGDKEMIASASADRTVMVWSLQSGECVSTYEGHVGSVNAVCVRQLQDKLLAFSASGDTTVHIWNPLPLSRKREGSQEEAHFNKPELVLRGHSHVVSSLALFSDEVLTGSHDCSLRLWEMETGKCVTDFTGHQLEVTGVTVHEGKGLGISSSKDKTIRLWDCRQSSTKEVGLCEGHIDIVNNVVVCGDDVFASSSEDNTVKLWDMRQLGTPLHIIRTSAAVNKMAANSVMHMLALPLDTGSIKIVDILTASKLCSIPKRNSDSKCVCAVDWVSQNRLVSCGFDSKIRTWFMKPQERSNRRNRPLSAVPATPSSRLQQPPHGGRSTEPSPSLNRRETSKNNSKTSLIEDVQQEFGPELHVI